MTYILFCFVLAKNNLHVIAMELRPRIFLHRLKHVTCGVPLIGSTVRMMMTSDTL
jgi:hypothetical protein